MPHIHPMGTKMLHAIVSILIIALTIYTKASEERQVCLTQRCIMAASTILSPLDLQAHPCEDFYQYACGNWIKMNPMPEGKRSWRATDSLVMKITAILKEVLEDISIKPESQAEKNARTYYMACMDKQEAIEKIGTKPLFELIKRAGGWNISGGFNVSTWNLQKSLEKLHEEYIGGKEFFQWGIFVDNKNSSWPVLAIDQLNLAMERRELYLYGNANISTAYLEYMTQVGLLLGGEEEDTRKQMEQVLFLKTKLAELVVHKEARGDVDGLYNKMTLEEFRQIAPFLDWHKYFTNAFRYVDQDISASLEILVPRPQYFGNLSVILSEYLSTNDGKRVLSNYIGWKVIDSLVSTLPKAFRDAKNAFTQKIFRMSVSRWKECVSETSSEMKMAVGAMFVRKAFSKESKFLAKQMLVEVREAFKANLRHLTWMDGNTRQLAKDKADAMTDAIGFPDYILDPRKLDKMEGVGLIVSDDEYFENKLRVHKFQFIEGMKLLNKPFDKTRWTTGPAVVNAFYSPFWNQMIFPAAYLQPPVYHFDYPMSYNFGSLGFVMGHEMTHGFDDQGRKYDKDGTLKQWWQNSVIRNFESQLKCYMDQYSAYEPVEGYHVNGQQTLSENIADNGGIKTAYYAYQNWMKKHPEDPVLPALNITSNQLFFLGFAQKWCSHMSRAGLIGHLLASKHSPDKYRVIGVLANSPEFAREFSCAAGSPMNPIKKCVLW